MPNSWKSKASSPGVFDDGWVENSNQVVNSSGFCDLLNFWTSLYADLPSRIYNHVFSGISVQKAVKVSSGFNVPSEISIVNFSWNEGVSKSIFHRFIRPDLPRGYRADALKVTEIHKIPPEGGPNSSNDIDSVVSEMHEFVSYVNDRAFVFCSEVEYDIVRDALRYLEKRVQKETFSGRNITIIKITDLFLALKWWEKMDHSKFDDLPTDSQIERESSLVKECLSRSCYNFKSNVRCGFHKREDIAFCSLMTANLFWLHLSDYLAEVYPRKDENVEKGVPAPNSPPPVIRNASTKIDPFTLNNLDSSPKVSENPTKQFIENSAPPTIKFTTLASVVWANSVDSRSGGGALVAVASKRLPSLPAADAATKEVAEPAPAKCASPDIIDLVLPPTWSQNFKQSQRANYSVAENHLHSNITTNGVIPNGSHLNCHLNQSFRSPGLSNGAEDFPPIGFGHGGLPLLPDYTTPRSRSRQSAQCTSQTAAPFCQY